MSFWLIGTALAFQLTEFFWLWKKGVEMRKIYGIPVQIGGAAKIHKIKFDNKKADIGSGRPSSFRQWRKAELEKMRIMLEK